MSQQKSCKQSKYYKDDFWNMKNQKQIMIQLFGLKNEDLNMNILACSVQMVDRTEPMWNDRKENDPLKDYMR